MRVRLLIGQGLLELFHLAWRATFCLLVFPRWIENSNLCGLQSSPPGFTKINNAFEGSPLPWLSQWAPSLVSNARSPFFPSPKINSCLLFEAITLPESTDNNKYPRILFVFPCRTTSNKWSRMSLCVDGGSGVCRDRNVFRPKHNYFSAIIGQCPYLLGLGPREHPFLAQQVCSVVCKRLQD